MTHEMDSVLAGGRDLTSLEAQELCNAMLSGDYSDRQIADVLVRLAEKGETPDELYGFVRGLVSHAEAIPFEGATVDTCGTGGSGLARFNVSTAAAFVLAASGLCVAKHGNRGSRAPNGSFDLLEALGVPIELGGAAVATCLEQAGLAFIYARTFHPVMKRVARARALAGRRTIFNLAGPLCNPTRVRVQVVGTSNPRDARTVAGCLRLMGRDYGACVTGNSGIDDVDLSGPALLFGTAAGDDPQTVDPRDLGLARVSASMLPGGDAPTNARLFLQLFYGDGPAALRDVVCLSAALVLHAARKVASLMDGLEMARSTFASGSARAKFEQYRDLAIRVSHRS